MPSSRVSPTPDLLPDGEPHSRQKAALLTAAPLQGAAGTAPSQLPRHTAPRQHGELPGRARALWGWGLAVLGGREACCPAAAPPL